MPTLPSNPIHGNPTRVATSAAIDATPGTLWAVLLEGGTTASSIDFTNDTDGSGTAVVGVTAPFTDDDASSQSTVFIDFTSVGGVRFSTACYATIAGTGAVAYVWFA